MLYFLNYPTFEQYLSIAYINLAIPGPNGISIKELLDLKDTECEKLLERLEPDYSDSLGFSVLRYQILKSLYPLLNEGKIVCNASIFQLINLLKEECEGLEVIEFTGDYTKINNNINAATKNNNYIAIYHSTPLELDKLTLNDKVIFLSDMTSMYGMKSYNVAWGAINDSKLFARINKKLHAQGPSCSYYSEILAIIALRNHNKINAINNELRSKNLDFLNSFFFRHNKLFNWGPSEVGYQGLLKFNNSIAPEQYCKELLDKAKILLNLSPDKSHIIINYGQKDVGNTLLQWEKYL